MVINVELTHIYKQPVNISRNFNVLGSDMVAPTGKSGDQHSKEEVVSLCTFCREDATILLTAQKENLLTQFPSLPVIKSSWRLTVRKLIASISGMTGKDIFIMRMTRFWVPDADPIFNIIYKVRCTLNEKKQIKLQNPGIPCLKWYTVDQIVHMTVMNQLNSPEIVEYVAQTLQPRNFYPLSTDLEASKEGFDLLNDVLERNILIEVESGFLTPQEQLLSTAHFTKDIQKRIYQEYLEKTFPNLYMNWQQFDSFVAELGWKKEEWPGLFFCADSTARGGLTFRDFLLFLAATEPETPHGSGSGEIRCQYIFRYFDKNRDNVLDFTELRALVAKISSVKGSQKPKDSEKSVDAILAESGITSKERISMNNFIKKVGELKFRGTSSIFRSKISVLKRLPNVSMEQQNDPTFQGNPKKQAFFPGIPWKSPLSVMMSNEEFGRLQSGKSKVFEIAMHAIRLTRDGLVDEIRPVDRVSHGKSFSMTGQDHFTRYPSVQYYDPKTPANELLAALEFFTNEMAGAAKFRKPACDWGKYDMNRLAKLLLTVCDKCIHVLGSEPRLLQLSSPLYILGDLHGNYYDLMDFEGVLWNLGLSLSPSSLLFLGDYVDRGPCGLEVVAYLFAQKVKSPQKIFLLRGNHEIRAVQKNFSFFFECQRKFGEDISFKVWDAINKVFDVMPIAAVVDSKIFCCHGGIPSPWLCTLIDQINTIPNPLPTPEEENALAWELMWNDPVKTDQITSALTQEMNANEGFAMNTSRKTGKFFSPEALDTFLKRNDLTHMVRAHEVKVAGFQVQQGGKLLTVFSSSGYCGGPNEAACIFVSHETIRVFRVNTNS